MDDLPLTQETNHVIYVGIVREPENVIVGGARLLLGGKVLGEIGDLTPMLMAFHGTPAAACGNTPSV